MRTTINRYCIYSVPKVMPPDLLHLQVNSSFQVAYLWQVTTSLSMSVGKPEGKRSSEGQAQIKDSIKVDG
jgi:hypothetical protein